MPISLRVAPASRRECHGLRAGCARHQAPPHARYRKPDKETCRLFGSADREDSVRAHSGKSPPPGARRSDGGRLAGRRGRPMHQRIPFGRDSIRPQHRHPAGPVHEGRRVCRSMPRSFKDFTTQVVEAIRIRRNRLSEAARHLPICRLYSTMHSFCSAVHRSRRGVPVTTFLSG